MEGDQVSGCCFSRALLLGGAAGEGAGVRIQRPRKWGVGAPILGLGEARVEAETQTPGSEPGGAGGPGRLRLREVGAGDCVPRSGMQALDPYMQRVQILGSQRCGGDS